jgi:hypothetical protein
MKAKNPTLLSSYGKQQQQKPVVTNRIDRFYLLEPDGRRLGRILILTYAEDQHFA